MRKFWTRHVAASLRAERQGAGLIDEVILLAASISMLSLPYTCMPLYTCVTQRSLVFEALIGIDCNFDQCNSVTGSTRTRKSWTDSRSPTRSGPSTSPGRSHTTGPCSQYSGIGGRKCEGGGESDVIGTGAEARGFQYLAE